MCSMSSRRVLTILVTLAAVLIAGAWVILFRNGVLAPPIAAPARPSLAEISRKFTETMQEFQMEAERGVRTASDDLQAPSP